MVAGWEICFEGIELRGHFLQHFGGENAGPREGVDADVAEMFLAADALGFHFVFDGGDGAEGETGRVLRGEDVEVLDLGQLGALLRLEADDHGDLLIAFAECSDGRAVDGGGGGIGTPGATRRTFCSKK